MVKLKVHIEIGRSTDLLAKLGQSDCYVRWSPLEKNSDKGFFITEQMDLSIPETEEEYLFTLKFFDSDFLNLKQYKIDFFSKI